MPRFSFRPLQRHLFCGALTLTAILFTNTLAQGNKPAPMRLDYTVSMPQPQTHLYDVAFSIGNCTAAELDLAMPTWTPGSYLQREYARNVEGFAARDQNGAELRQEKTRKNAWRIYTNASAAQPRTINVSYRVYAYELTVRTAHLDATHAYFNGAALFMFVRGALGQPYRVRFNTPAGWRVTSPLALAPAADGFYTAPNYDILVDSPAEIGTHRQLEFDVRGKPHRIAVWGDGAFDAARLKQDVAAIVETAAQMFGGLPYEHYTFFYHLFPGGGGGLEHLNSTSIQGKPDFFRTRGDYRRLLGTTAHEFFHVWNIKRIRPRALGPFDYENEVYSRTLWFAEGVTSYYGPVLLRRAGLSTAEEYLGDLAGQILTYEQTPGRLLQSAEAGSYDAWIKHYRPDENSPNSAISYYTKGYMLGLALDLEIRNRTNGAKSLDDVLRYLYENYALKGVGFPEEELRGVFEKIAGADLRDFFARYVSGTAEMDFDQWLPYAGLQLQKGVILAPYLAREETPGWLGFKPQENETRLLVKNVLTDSPAARDGLNTGDEIVALNGRRINAASYTEFLYGLRAGAQVNVTLFRREQLLNLTLTAAPKPPDYYVITRQKETSESQRMLCKNWLGQEWDKLK
ncbi:MAG: M61 family metallopeptidase [Blastocatellia bacterium]